MTSPSKVVRRGAMLAAFSYVCVGLLLSVGSFDVHDAVLATMIGTIVAAIATIDIEHQIIPDRLSVALLLMGLAPQTMLAWQLAETVVLADLLAGIALGGGGLLFVRIAYRLLRGREGLGLGDVKLAAAGGACVGLSGLPCAILCASCSALVYVGYMALRSREPIDGALRVPFGAFLAPSIWLAWAMAHVSWP